MRTQLRDDGFTLTEMLVALMIIATGLMALLGAFISASASIQGQQEDARAVRVALDRYEALRLRDWATDPDLEVRTHTGSATGSNGIRYDYVTTITLRDTKPDAVVPGDLVKDLRTVVTWRTHGGRTRNITYTTAIAQDPRSVGIRSGYIQAIQSFTIAPEPSLVVDYDGYTREPVYVTVAMSGFATTDVLPIRWTDANGARSVQATSLDGRYWRATIPQGSAGLRVANPQPGVASDITFSTTNRANQTASSVLKVFGPPNNPPVINTFTVAPNPVRVFNGGQNKDKNQEDVVFTCDVSGLDPSPSSTDLVTVNYFEDSGPKSISLRHMTGRVYQHTFLRNTTRFATSSGNFTYTCVVRRGSDGGNASKTTQVTVGRA